MQEGIEELIRTRLNKRTLAVILGIKDNQVDRFLPKPVAARLRRVIIDEVRGFADFACAIVDAFDDGTVVVNEAFLDQIVTKAAEIGRDDDAHRSAAANHA